jgi:DNA-binding response OmpR family regulator
MNAFNFNFQQQLGHIQTFLASTTGNWGAMKQAPAVLYGILQQQSSLLSYVYGFRFCVLVCLLCAALAFLFKKVGKPTGPIAIHNELSCKPRILIVNNNGEFTHRVSLLFQETHQYVVCEENDAGRVLETARSFKPDLILLDLIMPEADGTDIAAQLASDWTLHGVPIVFVTALITTEEARDARRIDGHRIVPKPTNSSELIKVVEENLPRRCDNRKEGGLKQACPGIQATKIGYVRPKYSPGVTRTRAAANDGRSIRNVVIFDDHPASLRLLRERTPTCPKSVSTTISRCFRA